MKIIKNHIHIGIENPFSVLHASDTHITFADARDGERKVRLAENRIRSFPDAVKNLQFIKNSWKPLLAGILMFVVVKYLDINMNKSILSTIIQIFIGAVIYIIILLITKYKFLYDVLNQILNFFKSIAFNTIPSIAIAHTTPNIVQPSAGGNVRSTTGV